MKPALQEQLGQSSWTQPVAEDKRHQAVDNNSDTETAVIDELTDYLLSTDSMAAATL